MAPFPLQMEMEITFVPFTLDFDTQKKKKSFKYVITLLS